MIRYDSRASSSTLPPDSPLTLFEKIQKFANFSPFVFNHFHTLFHSCKNKPFVCILFRKTPGYHPSPTLLDLNHHLNSALRLFPALLRIRGDRAVRFVLTNPQVKMSLLSTIWLSRSGASGATSAALCYSTFMSDDAKALARGLKRREPELLDRLIEQYQFRL